MSSLKIININDPGSGVQFGGDDLDRVNRLLSGEDLGYLLRMQNVMYFGGAQKLRVYRPNNTNYVSINTEAETNNWAIIIPPLTADQKLLFEALNQPVSNKTIDFANNTGQNIPTTAISDLAITTAKIANANVTEGKLAAGAVTNSILGANAVSDAKVSDVAFSKITGQIAMSQITDNTIANSKLVQITDKAKLPSSIAYEDESNVFASAQEINVNSANPLSVYRPSTTLWDEVGINFDQQSDTGIRRTFGRIMALDDDRVNTNEDTWLGFQYMINGSLLTRGNFYNNGVYFGPNGARAGITNSGLTQNRTYSMPDGGGKVVVEENETYFKDGLRIWDNDDTALQLYRTSTNACGFKMNHQNSASSETTNAELKSEWRNSTAGAEYGKFNFFIKRNGVNTAYFTIDAQDDLVTLFNFTNQVALGHSKLTGYRLFEFPNIAGELWAGDLIKRGRNKIGFFDDLLGHNSSGGGYLNSTDTNGGSVNDVDSSADANTWGVYELDTGTTSSTARAGVATTGFNGRQFKIGKGFTIVEFKCKIVDLADATDKYEIKIGLFDTMAFGTANYAVMWYYSYDMDTNGWRMISTNTSANVTNTDPAVDTDTDWHRFRIEVNAAGTSAEFFIDDVSKGTITTNLPLGLNKPLILGTSMRKNAGTGSKKCQVDYGGIDIDLTSQRS